MTKSRHLLIVGFFLAIVLALIYLFRPLTNVASVGVADSNLVAESKVSAKSSALENQAKLRPEKPNKVESPKASRLGTYRPGEARGFAQYPSLVDVSRTQGWWLYARSEEEAAWMDQYGFPSPAEESGLLRASDSELDALASRGDLNAKAHLGVRLAKSTFEKQDTNQASEVIETMYKTLAEGGPYQAMTILRAYGGMLAEFMQVAPDRRTDAQRQILERYGQMNSYAAAIGELYGDYTFTPERNKAAVKGLLPLLGLKETKEVSASNLAGMISLNARLRAEKNLEPLVIVARPLPPGGDVAKFPAPGQGVVLERR
jgi:hypothetical protein